MFKENKRLFERLSDRGVINSDVVPVAEMVLNQVLAGDTIARAYAGDGAASVNAMEFYDTIAEKVSLAAAEGTHMLEAIITTGDITNVTKAIDTEVNKAEEPISTDSVFMRGARKRAHGDFKGVNTIDTSLDTLGTFLQPEGTNVRYEPFAVSEDGYTVAKYSRAIGWTWEAKQNGDFEAFLDQAQALGYSARLTRLRTLLNAIVAATSRDTPTGGNAAAGGPTIDNIKWVITQLQNNAPPRRLGGLAGSMLWEFEADEVLGNRYLPGEVAPVNNPAYRKAVWHTEEYLPTVLADAVSGNALDWLAFDDRIASWLEFGFLRGFNNPKIIYKAPDVRGNSGFGSFDNMTDAVKVLDVHGAKVTDVTKVLRVAGA